MNKQYLKNLEQPLKVEHDNGILKISVGLTRVEGNDCHPTIPSLKIIDTETWGDDLVLELTREEEDGSSPLSNLLDKAIQEAIDMGSIAIDHTKYEKDMKKRNK